MRFAFIPALVVAMATMSAEDFTFKIPPVKTSLTVENQPVTITTSGMMSRVSKDRGHETFRLKLSTDLSDVQANITGLLRSQLDRSERCGDRIAIEHATLVPAEPAGLLTVRLHYERWACAKALGKQITTKLAAGTGVVPVKLTPAVEGGRTVRLDPEVGTIEADGALGELLRSGSLGEMLREKIRNGLVSAIQENANLDATLPPALQGIATIQSVRFTNAGSGRLALAIAGQCRVTADQVQLLLGQLKEHLASQ
jgi:hypothetical protein